MTSIRTVRDMSLPYAQSLAATACLEAERLGIMITVVVVDRGGHPVYVVRMDGAALCAFPLALAKAETAATTLAPSALWFATTQPGGADWGMTMALAGRFTAMPGGLPASAHGEVIGAIGISGGEAAQDVRCAEAALGGAMPDA